MKNVFMRERDTSLYRKCTNNIAVTSRYATFRKWKDLIWHVQLDRDRLPSSCSRW